MTSILAIPVDTVPTISGGTVAAGSRTNMLSNRYGLVCRFTISTTLAATVDIDFDFGAAITADTIAVLWHNLRSTDSFIVTAGTTAGASDVLAATTINGWGSTEKNTSAAAKAWKVLSTPKTARYWRIRISTASGLPAGYAEISRVVFANRHNFAVDYSTLELVEDDRSRVEQAEYGEDVEDVRRISFGWRAKWKFGTLAEMAATHQRLVMRGRAKPIFFLPMPDEANAQDLAAFGFMRNPAKTASSAYDLWELAFDVISQAA